MKYWIQACINKWLDKRIPPSHAYQMDVNNTFILPTRFGWAIAGLMSCLFILGTNYQNNIILMFCYFVFALLLLALFHSYVNFVQFHITFRPISNSFANQHVQLQLDLSHKANRTGLHSLSNIAIFSKHYPVYEYLEDGVNTIVIRQFSRGLHDLQRVSVESIFPFGLFKCWSHLSVHGHFLVYPAPIACSLKLRQLHSKGNTGNKSGVAVTSEDLQGIRDYRDSDPIHHVSWKHFAKGQGLLSKDFSERSAISGWLHFSDYFNGNIEYALSEVTFQILELSKQEANFGFSIGKQQIMPNTGAQHQRQCLKAAALYRHKQVPHNSYDSDDATEMEHP
ncbi:MAG: hypothetical protein ACI9IT_002684 [Glaciecola sp.]|jgi:uncharacterized protein (DUF58 family)